MKNVFLIPSSRTAKSGDLVEDKYGAIHIASKKDSKQYLATTTVQNLYITSDASLKEGDWCLLKSGRLVKAVVNSGSLGYISSDLVAFLYFRECDKKIVLTNNFNLVNEGVQEITEDSMKIFLDEYTGSFGQIQFIKVEYTNNLYYLYDSLLETSTEKVSRRKIGKFGETRNSITFQKTSQVKVEVKNTTDVSFRGKYVRFENLTEEQKEVLVVLVEQNFLNGTRRSALVPTQTSQIMFTRDDMIKAAEYGYNFHKTTQFPEQQFEDSCINNTKQWLTTFNKD